MTSTQKSKITELRGNGESYANVAETLGLSVNTVKSFCRRNNLNIINENKIADNVVCKVCQKAIEQVNGRKPRKFCSDKCRIEWWNAHPEQVARKAVYTYTCPHCQNTFTAYGNSRRKFCSHACYISERFGGDSSE
ncbi:hypothetical protein AGMMS49975_26690 [Clostridia bacterium]|nr:hypothetical protein AGMMS49975_26690 [Clostridia bacterium]